MEDDQKNQNGRQPKNKNVRLQFKMEDDQNIFKMEDRRKIKI